MNRFVGPMLILLCTVIWGSAFIAQKLGADHYGPFAINCYRNLMAGVFLWGALALRNRFSRRVRDELGASRLDTAWRRSEIAGGAVSGVVLFLAMLTQQLGIERTTPGVSAFLTANYVLWVPVFAWVLGKGRPGFVVWAGVLLATFGSFLISVSGTSDLFGIGAGELWTLACAALFAVQIMVVDHFAHDCDMLRFSLVQVTAAGLVALPFVFLPSELARGGFDAFVKGLPALIYLGVFSSGIAYTLQNLGQARTPPAIAAIIMSMESVFGVFFGWLLLGDVMSVRQLFGCAFVLLAVILLQVVPSRKCALALSLSIFAGIPAAFAGYRVPPHPMRQLTNDVMAASGRRLLAAQGDLPTKYDLRNEDGKGTTYLSPVKDQLGYGTCWAYAAMVGIEYLLRRDEGIDADLSENNLANRHGFPVSFADGGTHEMAMAVFLREEGPVTETLDPYASVGTSVREHGVRMPRKVVFVPARTFGGSLEQLRTDNDVIKRALMRYGPLVTSYYHDANYLKGAAYYCKYRVGDNHAVSIVGWDDSYAASNFRSVPPGDGAFIVKNSWGTSLFDRGYTYISYYDANFGNQPQIAYLRLSKGEDYGRLYEHDPYGYVSSKGFGETTAYAMNVFTARQDERLAAFGFYALKANTTYSAEVVVNPVVLRGELFGTPYAVVSGTATEAGYEVHDFVRPVPVGAGTNFAIVVKIETPKFWNPLAVTHNEVFSDGMPYVDGVKAVPGKSYISPDPTWYGWVDISSDGQYFCCKVYTKASAEDKTTCGAIPVPYSWLDAYSGCHGAGDYLKTSFYGSYNALSEHVAANGRTVAASFAQGLDPDNAAETNLVATIACDAKGRPFVGVSPRNDALWSYTTLGSTDLRAWHPSADGDSFFRVKATER